MFRGFDQYESLGEVLRFWAQNLWCLQNPHASDQDAKFFFYKSSKNPINSPQYKGDFEMYFFYGLRRAPKFIREPGRLVGKFVEQAMTAPLRRAMFYRHTKWLVDEIEIMMADIAAQKGAAALVAVFPHDRLYCSPDSLTTTLQDLKIQPSPLMQTALAGVRHSINIVAELKQSLSVK